MTDVPPYLQPFVLAHRHVEPVQVGDVDQYLPDGRTPAPAVLMVHGGPVPPPERQVRPPRRAGGAAEAPRRSQGREAGRAVDVIDVPGAHHGFETVDDTPDARAAIRASLAWRVAALR